MSKPAKATDHPPSFERFEKLAKNLLAAPTRRASKEARQIREKQAQETPLTFSTSDDD